MSYYTIKTIGRVKRDSESTNNDETNVSALKNNEEVIAHIALPEDGGWGWVVVACSFFTVFVLDGMLLTFGTIINEISSDFKVGKPMIALVNSVSNAVYSIAAPIAAAVINRYGFRVCAMTGSIIACTSYTISQYCPMYELFLCFYGFISGLGFAITGLSSTLVVGYYFEKRRALAFTIASVGSGCGLLTFSRMNTYLLHFIKWQTLIALQSGLLGLIYFVAFAYRPLKSVELTALPEDIVSLDTTLPISADKNARIRSNTTFKTVAAVIEEAIGGNVDNKSIMTKSTVSLKKLLEIERKSVITFQNINRSAISLRIEGQSSSDNVKKTYARLFKERRNSRPMYRDDAFFNGEITTLKEFEQFENLREDEKTGLEYQMAVNRATTRADYKEKGGICTIAVKRVLFTMLDPTLLKRPSFIMLCASGVVVYFGMFIPFMFLKERNESKGLPPEHTEAFLSVIGLANICGRLILGVLSNGVCDVMHLLVIPLSICGLVTMLSHLSYNIIYQYVYCIIFGLCISSIQCLKSIMIVSLYGLDKLTNGVGILLMFIGIGSLLSTPICGSYILLRGYTEGFMLSGCCIMIGGLILTPVRKMAMREEAKKNRYLAHVCISLPILYLLHRPPDDQK